MKLTKLAKLGAFVVVAMVAIVAGTGGQAMAQGAAAAAAGSTAAQRQARGEMAAKAFVQGQYEEALTIYLDLYAQSGGRPEYLRNIGRCQQKLNRHDPAIESFKEYLRQGKNLSAAEKTEVNGFIAEVQAARAASAAPPASTVPPTPAVIPPPAPAPAPASPAPVLATGTPPPGETPPPTPGNFPGPAIPQPGAAPQPETPASPAPWAMPPPPAPSPPPQQSSGLRTGGVVALVGSAVLAMAGTLTLIKARSNYDDGLGRGCKSADRPASCAGTADSIETTNTISKILFVGAGLAGAGGVTMLILAPAPSGETRVSLGARFSF